MPSAQNVSPHPERIQTRSASATRGSWGLILVGIILLILGLLLFLYVKVYRPGQKEFVFKGSIKWTGSTAQAVSPPAIAPLSAASLSPPPDQSRVKRETIRARPLLNHSQHANGHRASSFSLTQTQSQTASSEQAQSAEHSPQTSTATPAQTPERINQQEEPNALRRFFRWLAGLFKGKKRAGNRTNSPPVISAVTLSETTLEIKQECLDEKLIAGNCALKGNQVQVRVKANDADGDELRYKPVAQVGKVSNDKGNITWDLTGVPPGTHTLKVSASDGKAESRLYPVTLNIRQCKCEMAIIAKSPCPYPVNVGAPASVHDGKALTFSSDVAYDGSSQLNYNWTISPASARIMSGTGTPAITVDTTGLGNQRVAAILVVDDGSGERACRQTAQAMTNVLAPNKATLKAKLLGRIVDSNGAAIRGAEVTVVGEDGKSRRAVSDAEGRYEFAELPVGTYSVNVTHPNFRGGSWTVPLEAGTNPTFQFPLAPGDGTGGNLPPTPTPTPTPTPGSSPTPTPTPSASPTNTPTPAPYLKSRKQDEIRVAYPERFLKDTEGEVSFELEQVEREVIATTTNANGNISVVSRPAAIPGVAVGTPLADAFAGYEAFATVRLIPTGLLITSPPTELEQPLNDKLAKWVWRLKPEDNAGAEVSFRFEVSVVWRAKDGKLPDKNIPNVWPHEPFTVPAGLPLTVKAAGYTAPVSLGGGVMALGLGVLQKRRRRLLGEEEIEEEPRTGTMADTREAMPPAKMEEPEDEVSSTVYAPTEALPGDSFLVQLFVHLPEQAAALDELAKAADDAARERMTTELKKTIKRGTELTFHLTMPGLEIDEPSQSCVWEGEPACVQFGVTIPQDRKPGNIIGTVIVSEASVPIGHLKFKFKIAGSVSQEAAAPANQAIAAGNLTRYKQAFISYASKDRAEVLKRVQMLNLVHVKFFQDLLTLEPGDNWEQLLYQYIDQSDVFYLFWSHAASESAWVKKEIFYAIQRKAGNEEASPEIVPVIIEGPPAVKPPGDLSFLHFNDKFMYFISAGEPHD